jgi:hypothetical protein
LIEIGPKFFDGPVNFAPESDAVEFAQHRSVKALDDTVRLRTSCFCPAVVDIFGSKVELGIVKLTAAKQTTITSHFYFRASKERKGPRLHLPDKFGLLYSTLFQTTSQAKQ